LLQSSSRQDQGFLDFERVTAIVSRLFETEEQMLRKSGLNLSIEAASL